MKYNIYTREQVTPKYIVVHGATSEESTLNRGDDPVYPETFLYIVARCKDFDLYSADPLKRQELWQDSAGIELTQEMLPFMHQVYEKQISALWDSANSFQEQYISGLAGGLLTMGVIMQKPKAKEVMQWSGALWAEYYTRKDIILSGGTPNYDFTSCGAMPYSVPELREELGI